MTEDSSAPTPGSETLPPSRPPSRSAVLYVLFGGLFVGLSLGLVIRGLFGVQRAPAKQPEQAERPKELATPKAPKPDDKLVARGAELFARNCATCHGDKGMGDGQASYLLYPRPRDFSMGRFRLVSTDNGLPADEDLFRTLTRGMPGTAMPSWSHLPAEDRWALAFGVRKLIEAGRLARLRKAGVPEARAAVLAAKFARPGKPVPVPPEPKVTTDHLARGRELFIGNCANCHGTLARGDGTQKDHLTDEGHPIAVPDLTRGVFKGGAGGNELALRVLCGIPGTPMPSQSSNFETGDDLWSVIHYVQSIAAPGAQARAETTRRTLVAAAAPKLEEDPLHKSWRKAPATYLALMPIWQRADRAQGVTVRALHDGKRVGLQLSWEDPERNDMVCGQRLFSDAAAVQISGLASPPLFTMGTHDDPVTIWHWKAAWQRDRDGGFGDVEQQFTRLVADLYQWPEPLFKSGWGAGNLLSDPGNDRRCEQLVAAGFGSLSSLPRKSQVMLGNAKWVAGYWHIVFIRPLSGTDGAITLVQGKPASVAFAVWDGGAGDRNGQKSVTIWHKLEIK